MRVTTHLFRYLKERNGVGGAPFSFLVCSTWIPLSCARMELLQWSSHLPDLWLRNECQSLCFWASPLVQVVDAKFCPLSNVSVLLQRQPRVSLWVLWQLHKQPDKEQGAYFFFLQGLQSLLEILLEPRPSS